MGFHARLTASDGHRLDAYLAEPISMATSAIVIVQEVFGVNRHIRAVVDDYATQGFIALAPGLFDRVQPGIQLNYNSADVTRGMQIVKQIGMDKALLDVAAALAHAARLPNIKKVGIVGFCFGGTLSWLAATRHNPAAAVCYYGGQIAKFASEKPRCPVIMHFGAKDAHIPASEIQKIQQAHPDLPIYLYEKAGHGFNCDHRPDYEPYSAALARQRTLAFLKSSLESAPDS